MKGSRHVSSTESSSPSGGKQSERWDPKSSLIFGPVPISAFDCPIVIAAGRVRPARETGTVKRFASGWGVTFEDAERHCRFEADETFFAQLIPPDRIVRARADCLSGDVVEPSTLMLSSDAQTLGHHQSAGRMFNHKMRAQSCRKRPIDWIASQPGKIDPTWVPARLCILDYPGDKHAGMPAADSSGLATGESFDDACVRGFCELVERDATAIWWYNSLVLPKLDLKSLGDPVCAAYEAWSSSRNRELRLLALTLDLAIPVVAALTWNSAGSQVAMGTAAGSSFAAAARRAVGELAQCEANLRLLKRTAQRSGTAGLTPGARHLFAWHTAINVGKHLFLQGSGFVEDTDPENVLDWRRCMEIAEARALRPVAIDLTDRRGPSLARVFVPGLRSTKPVFRRGRLFDVPRSLGFSPLSAASMGRVPSLPF